MCVQTLFKSHETKSIWLFRIEGRRSKHKTILESNKTKPHREVTNKRCFIYDLLDVDTWSSSSLLTDKKLQVMAIKLQVLKCTKVKTNYETSHWTLKRYVCVLRFSMRFKRVRRGANDEELCNICRGVAYKMHQWDIHLDRQFLNHDQETFKIRSKTRFLAGHKHLIFATKWFWVQNKP